MYEQRSKKIKKQNNSANHSVYSPANHNKSVPLKTVPDINRLNRVSKVNSIYSDCRIVQRMGEPWESYKEHMREAEKEIFPYCNNDYAKATWAEPADYAEFDIKIVLHTFSKDRNKWEACGYVQAVLRDQVLMFHTQSNGGNVGVATILFPTVLQWVSDKRENLKFDTIQMNPAGGAASKTVIGMLSRQLGEKEHFDKAKDARDRRKAANTPLPDDPNKWSTAYNEEFAEYFYSLKHLGTKGLSIGSEGFNLVGNLDYGAELSDYLTMLKEAHIISPDVEMEQIKGENEFEKLLSLFKQYLAFKADKDMVLAGSQINIEGEALNLLLQKQE